MRTRATIPARWVCEPLSFLALTFVSLFVLVLCVLCQMREFLAHCALIPTVASQYKSRAKPAEESKEESSSTAPSAVPVLDDASLQYDTLRAEMRAHADKVGSRQSLAQFFERYLR